MSCLAISCLSTIWAVLGFVCLTIATPLLTAAPSVATNIRNIFPRAPSMTTAAPPLDGWGFPAASTPPPHSLNDLIPSPPPEPLRSTGCLPEKPDKITVTTTIYTTYTLFATDGVHQKPLSTPAPLDWTCDPDSYFWAGQIDCWGTFDELPLVYQRVDSHHYWWCDEVSNSDCLDPDGYPRPVEKLVNTYKHDEIGLICTMFMEYGGPDLLEPLGHQCWGTQDLEDLPILAYRKLDWKQFQFCVLASMQGGCPRDHFTMLSLSSTWRYHPTPNALLTGRPGDAQPTFNGNGD